MEAIALSVLFPLTRLLELPRFIRLALENLAPADRVREFERTVRSAIESLPGEDDEIPEFNPFDLEESVEVEWEEGGEEFRGFTINGLYALHGIYPKGEEEPTFPFFNRYLPTPAKSRHKQHADVDKATSKDSEARELLRARWHQVLGVVKMVKLAFHGKAALLMDEVGLGKTLQVVGVIAELARLREAKEKNRQVPCALW